MKASKQPRSIAAEALAAGRPALASSFRFHRPRGPVCGRGHCFACELQTPAGRVLACQTPALSAVRPRRDFLRPLGRVAERWPPWFYERRFLRTELVRRSSLELIRRVSSAGRLAGPAHAGPTRAYEELHADTVVVGSATEDSNALVIDLARGDLALGVYPGQVLGALLDGRLVAVHFERLVVATGSYERLPPIPGNDLPGLIGLQALELYAEALRLATRIAVWGPPDAVTRAETIAASYELDLVWTGERPPQRLSGRGRLEHLHVDDTKVACDLFVTGVAQPAVELPLQAGASVRLTTDELPILVVSDMPPWLDVRGAAAAHTSRVPDVVAHGDAFACLCEDVRVSDLRACVAGGFEHPELVKRRTGAMTGPCQGKLCVSAVLAVLRELGVDAVPTTARPLARPATLGELSAYA